MADTQALPLAARLRAQLKRALAPVLLKKTSLLPLLAKRAYKISTPLDKIELSVSGLRPGLYFLRIIHNSNDSLLGARLATVALDGEESEHNIYLFETRDQKEFYGTVKLSDETVSLRFYPSRLPVNIAIENLYLRAINNFGRDWIYGQTYVRVRSFGLRWTVTKIWDESLSGISRLIKGGTDDSYATWWKLYGQPSEATLDRQRAQSMSSKTSVPEISIVMPVFETPLHLLEAAVNSVLNQSYSNWELCIADDASTNSELLEYLRGLSQSDARIRVVFRNENGHISAASNSALELARGKYVGFLDHDDELSRDALYKVMQVFRQKPATELLYSDEDVISEEGEPLYPQFKPDWNPDFARSINYVCHFMVLRRERLTQLGGFRDRRYDGAQDFDLMLRATETLSPELVQHIPHILYHWRATAQSTVSDHGNKDYSTAAGILALNDHFERLGIDATAGPSEIPTAYRTHYHLPSPAPSATLIVPTHNSLRVLRGCIESILEKTAYDNYEVLIVDNRSDDPDTLEYLQSCVQRGVQVVPYDKTFNYSAINNFAVSLCDSEVVVLLNNDTEVCSSDWLVELVSHAVRPEVGAVGAKLFYADGRIQHAGVLLGMGPDKVAGHAFKGTHKHDTGPMARTRLIQSYCAVTAACMAVSRKKYLEVGGLDEANLAIAFNDVDFCLKLRELGYTNIWTPYSQLYHYESYSRGHDHGDNLKHHRFMKERDYMHKRWGNLLDTDPFFNPNLSRDFSDFSLAWPPYHETAE